MENQHRRISGYRELDETEIALMNKIKALGIEIDILITHVTARHVEQRRLAANTSAIEPFDITEKQRLDAAEPERWLALGRSDLQTGLMKLTRAVAQPGFF